MLEIETDLHRAGLDGELSVPILYPLTYRSYNGWNCRRRDACYHGKRRQSEISSYYFSNHLLSAIKIAIFLRAAIMG